MVDKFVTNHRTSRDVAHGPTSAFDPIAYMIIYMLGDPVNQWKEDPDAYETAKEYIKNLYSNYGCNCWVNGVEAGLISKGKPVDKVDKYCQELYQCYRCINLDYQLDSDITYRVNLTEYDESGDTGSTEYTTESRRMLDCSGKHI